jgi:small subunit ribosomal protein S21
MRAFVPSRLRAFRRAKVPATRRPDERVGPRTRQCGRTDRQGLCLVPAPAFGAFPEGRWSATGSRPDSVAVFFRRGRFFLIEIEIQEGDRIEWALKQFRRKMLRSGLFKDMKRKRFYEKPSEAKKRKQADARRRSLRARRRR